jgi:hypothetical protein
MRRNEEEKVETFKLSHNPKAFKLADSKKKRQECKTQSGTSWGMSSMLVIEEAPAKMRK